MRGNTSRCQCGPSWSHAFSGTSASPRMRCKPAHELGEQAQRRRQQVALEPVGLGAGRRDQELVGDAARDRAAGRDAVALEHLEHRGQPALGGHRRRGGRQPGELRVRVRQRRAGLVALVEDREAVAARVPRPSLPRLGDELDRRVVQARRTSARAPGRESRPPAARAPDRGSARPGPASRSGRRRAAASPAASGPRCPRRTGQDAGSSPAGSPRSRPVRARRRDRHPATGRRVVAEVGQRRRLGQASGRSARAVNARSISIGIGNAIVVDGVEPSSSSVCR